MRAWPRLALAVALVVLGGAAAQADELELEVEIPEVVSESFEVTDAQLRWGLNEETGSASFAGECNFLSAGAVGDTGGSKLWTEKDGFFRSSAGEVRIVKPVETSTGSRERTVSFADRCTDPQGRPVKTSSLRGSGIQAVIEGGTGFVDPQSGDARIAWSGSVTVVYYGGLTYWWFTDPVLEITGGRGTLTATAGGFGSTREDMDQWVELEPTPVTLARLEEVSLQGGKGFTVTPAYRGVKVSAPEGAPAQVRAGEDWGSFPQDFVTFQGRTGQQSFWYSSGGARDGAKPATALTVSYDAKDPKPHEDEDRPGEDEKPEEDEDSREEEPRNRVNPPPVRRPPSGLVAAPQLAAGTRMPTALPAVTVLPVSAPLAAAEPLALASTGGAPRPLMLAAAALLLGTALTVLGFRRSWLEWPSRKDS